MPQRRVGSSGFVLPTPCDSLPKRLSFPFRRHQLAYNIEGRPGPTSPIAARPGTCLYMSSAIPTLLPSPLLVSQDRCTRIAIPTVERKHLPPPPVGETMGHGFTPPRDRGLGAAASRSTIGAGSGVGSTSPPRCNNGNNSNSDQYKRSRGDGFAADPPASPAVASRGVGRKRKGGGGTGSTRTTLRKGAFDSSKEFPAIPSQHPQEFVSSPPAEGDGGALEGGGGRKGWRRDSSLRMGWINSRRSRETLQELFRTT